MEDPTSELPTVATIIGCPETLSDTNGLVATPLAVPSGNGTDDPIQKVLLENMCSAFISKKERDVVYCDVCDVSCTGEQAFKAHVGGSKHAKKLKEKQSSGKVAKEPFIYEDPQTKTFECTLCKIKLNAKNQIAAHVSGGKHKSRLAPNQKIYSAAPRRMPFRQDLSANLLYCPTCDVHANSDLQMEQHMASAKHVNKVNSSGAPSTQVRRPLGPPGRFMPYAFKERDVYDYDDYDRRREYYRGERDYDNEYDYPCAPGEGGGYWSRERMVDGRYMESRMGVDYNGGPPRGYNHYLRESRPFGNRPGYGNRPIGDKSYINRPPFGVRPPMGGRPPYGDRSQYGVRPFPPNRFGLY